MSAPSQPEIEPTDVLHLISASVALLFENGQTTERTISAATKLGVALGYSAIVLPRWGEVNIRIDGLADRPQEVIAATPAGVDMNKVIAAVGIIVTPAADRLRLPFAAIGFASVVSLIPGVYLFRMAGGLVALMAQGEKASPDLLLGTVTDGVTASLILLAMAFGLIAPKMLIEHFYPNIGEVRKPTS